MKKIFLSRRAEKEFKKLPKFIQVVVAKKLRLMGESDDDWGLVESLRGYKGIFRVRLGDYRLVYRLRENEIFVVCISHRKEVYEKLRRFLG